MAKVRVVSGVLEDGGCVVWMSWRMDGVGDACYPPLHN